ncbi:MAG: TRAP transporter substrate-binding protein DctP [Treponema sp.]|nr:TRAP transporter substrate-binding protein DctP [Treponema sp.]
MNGQKFKLLTVILLFFIVCPIFAQGKITIRLASLVPENTAWGAGINRIAAEWSRITNGEVEVIVFHNGTAGGEGEVLRKLKINQIQAAVFTSAGVSAIMPEVMAISYPFLIRNDEELNAVMLKIKPQLDTKIQQNGYVTLAWACAGWIKIFSKMPVFTPDELKKARLSSPPDDQQMIQAFRLMGYQIVPVSLPDTLVAFRSGMIDATYISPIYAAGNQLFGVAGNMVNVNVAPFMGGVFMNNTAWRRIPDKYKPQLLEVCKKLEREIESSISGFETEAVSTMVKYGLKVNNPSSQQVQIWYDDTAKYENNLVGGVTPVFNREYYLQIKDILTQYRKGR